MAIKMLDQYVDELTASVKFVMSLRPKVPEASQLPVVLVDVTSFCNKLEQRIKKVDEAWEDMTCGVCYDGFATEKLNCCHKLCSYCASNVRSCPFCRAPYTPKPIASVARTHEEITRRISEQSVRRGRFSAMIGYDNITRTYQMSFSSKALCKMYMAALRNSSENSHFVPFSNTVTNITNINFIYFVINTMITSNQRIGTMW